MELHRFAEEDRPRTTRMVYFYKSGDYRFLGIRVPINLRKYKNLDPLLDELSYKVPGLTFGVRCLATPKGGHRIQSIQQLQHLGSYICTDSTHSRRIPGVDLQKIKGNSMEYNFRGVYAPPKYLLYPQKSVPNGLPAKSERRTLSENEQKSGPKRKKVVVRHWTPKVAKDPENRIDFLNLESSSTSQSSTDLESAVNKLVRKVMRKDRIGAQSDLESEESRSLKPASAPETKKERKALTIASLAPLDSKRLKHVQRRRLVTKSVDVDPFPSKVPRSKQKQRRKNTSSERTRRPDYSPIQKYSEEHHAAATTIQANWRGYQARRQLKQEHEAAKKIQARYRGYRVRKWEKKGLLLPSRLNAVSTSGQN